jgi:hypothetical protein
MGMIVREHVAYSMQDKANIRFDVDLIDSIVAVEKEFGVFNPGAGGGHHLALIADLTGVFPDNHPDIARWRKWFAHLKTVYCKSDPKFTMHDKLRQIIFDNVKPAGKHLPMRFYWNRQDDPNKQDITTTLGRPPQPMDPTSNYLIVTITSLAADAAWRQARAKAGARRKARRKK